MRFAVANGYIEKSPIAHILPGDLLKSHTVVNFARIEVEDLPGLLQKIELYQGNPLTRLAMKLMALSPHPSAIHGQHCTIHIIGSGRCQENDHALEVVRRSPATCRDAG